MTSQGYQANLLTRLEVGLLKLELKWQIIQQGISISRNINDK